MNNNNRFYHKIDKLDTDEGVEIYLGRNSGTQIENDIFNAKKEILILSPYISSNKIDLLLNAKQRDIDVRLVFGDKDLVNKPDGKTSLATLIRQHQEKDNAAIESRRKKLKTNKILISIFIILSILWFFAMAFMFYSSINNKLLSPINIAVMYMFIAVPLYLIIKSLYNKRKNIKRTRVNQYHYTDNLKFKYLREYSPDMFIHSKLYVIDREIAYVGSVNFTNNGFGSNFETRVRITKKDTISDLIACFNSIYDDSYKYPAYQTQWLGEQIYYEPPY